MFYEKIFQSSESQIFWQRFTWVLKQIPECKSLGEWAVIIFKFFVNEIYGDKVFCGYSFINFSDSFIMMNKKIFRITIIVTSGICVLFLTGILIGREYFIVDNMSPIKSDVIIVLGYPAQNNGQPSSTMKIRLEKAGRIIS